MKEKDWREQMLTREDVGYGPARAYEPGPGLPARAFRERRTTERERPTSEFPAPAGPYWERLRRRRRPDPWIRADVEESLFLDTWIDADRITIDVENGVVTLLGTLPDHEEVHRAIDDAARVPGVSRVRSRLETST